MKKSALKEFIRNQIISELSLLEQDDEYVSFFISAHKFQEPLVLDSEVA